MPGTLSDLLVAPESGSDLRLCLSPVCVDCRAFRSLADFLRTFPRLLARVQWRRRGGRLSQADDPALTSGNHSYRNLGSHDRPRTPPPSSPPVALQVLADEALAYASAIRSAATQRSYALDWAHFTTWTESGTGRHSHRPGEDRPLRHQPGRHPPALDDHPAPGRHRHPPPPRRMKLPRVTIPNGRDRHLSRHRPPSLGRRRCDHRRPLRPIDRHGNVSPARLSDRAVSMVVKLVAERGSLEFSRKRIHGGNP